ncbi:hypothetical protein FACS189494_07220 [Spirochaetia bacterium]|nr:hypothetical protein FACS189494_07220 [Spirochaetia bacterium]
MRATISDEEIKYNARMAGDTKSWTRNRAMPLWKMLLCTIGRKALTASMEIRLFFAGTREPGISKQDYFARRQKLNYEVFEKLNCNYLQDFYRGEEPKLWNGYITLAIDGSGVEISNSDENRKTFGVAKNNYGETVASVLSNTDTVKQI